MKRFFWALSLVTLFSAPHAQAQNKESAIEGLGLRQCSVLSEARADNSELYQAFALWLSGFLTAANAYEDNTYDLTPWQPIEMSIAQVAKYCAANPDKRMAEGVAAYLTFLRANRLREPAKLISLRNGETSVFIYTSVLEQVRAKLRESGDLGTTAGDTFDTAFGQAILTFQRKNQLKQTGLPDTATLLKLLH